MSDPIYKAVLLDLDDTLIDRKSAYDALYREFYEQQPAIKTVSTWDEAREFFWSLSPWNATNARKAIVEIMNRWPGVESDPETHHRFYFKTLISHLQLMDGALDLVSRMNASGIPWGVVTNGDANQLKKVEKTGLQDTIPFVLASELFGINKPAPEIYHEAVRRLGANGTPISQVLFVGDNPYTDILGAHNVGMSTAWLTMGRQYPSDAPPPTHHIDSPLDVAELVGI